MILGYGNMVHFSPVNIDETDDGWQMEIDASFTSQLPKKNRETK